MNLDEFIKKYDGKYVEYHSYGEGAKFQCVDLSNQYIVEVLNKQAIIGTNAQDVPSKVSKQDYDYILNTPTGVPLKGDIIVFKSADNVGHISIFVEGTATKFTSFDQNYPTGSPCKLVGHYYTNVLGWLHPILNPTITIEQSVFETLVAKSTKFDALNAIGYDSPDKINALRDKLTEVEATLDATTKAKKIVDDLLVKSETKVSELVPSASEWEVLTKMYNVSTATDMDKIVRTLKEEISATTISSNDNQVLKECKQNLANAKKESVKSATKKVLLNELFKRFFK